MRESADSVKLAIRVKPGSKAPRVGGAWGDPPELVVAVAQPAVGGAANAAVVKAVAAELGLPRSAVTLVRGATSRSKVLAVEGDARELRDRLATLLLR